MTRTQFVDRAVAAIGAALAGALIVKAKAEMTRPKQPMPTGRDYHLVVGNRVGAVWHHK